MATAERTLVKSQPELWQLLEDEDRILAWMASLLKGTPTVEVIAHEPEHRLAWAGAVAEEAARIEIELAEKGWGTNVSIKAKAPSGSTKLDDWLDALLDELAEPEKRPFRDGI
jgi:hypothetical protein